MGSTLSTPIQSLNTWFHLPSTLRGLYTLTYGMLMGHQTWMTFIGGIVAYRTLPKQTFGLLQSRLFPAYFHTSTLLSLTLLHPTLFLTLKSSPSPFSTTLSYLSTRDFWLSTSGLTVLTLVGHVVNGVWVGPETSRVMFERHRVERLEAGGGGKGKGKEGEPSPEITTLTKKFNILHSVSSLLNLGSLITTGMIGWEIGVRGVGAGAGMASGAGIGLRGY